MRPKFQKKSALKLAGRIIPQSGGYKNQSKLRVFIPVVTVEIIYEEICYLSITNMNPKASGGVHIFLSAG